MGADDQCAAGPDHREDPGHHLTLEGLVEVGEHQVPAQDEVEGARRRLGPNVLLTPHIGSATPDTRLGMVRMALANLVAGLQGRTPPNVVDG